MLDVFTKAEGSLLPLTEVELVILKKLLTKQERCRRHLGKKTAEKFRGVAQPGRVLGLGPRCRRFESSRPDQLYNMVCVYLLCYFFIRNNLIMFFNELIIISLCVAR